MNTQDLEGEKCGHSTRPNITENWLINSFMFWKQDHCGHIEHHSGLERTVITGQVIQGRADF